PPRATQPGTPQAHAARSSRFGASAIPQARATQPSHQGAPPHAAPRRARKTPLLPADAPSLEAEPRRALRHSETPKTVAGGPRFGDPSASRIPALPPSEPTIHTLGRPAAAASRSDAPLDSLSEDTFVPSQK